MTDPEETSQRNANHDGSRSRRELREVDVMGGFAKGLSVIEAFGRERDSLTIAEVARISGLDRATARRCLLTLVKLGYASSDGRYFELTPHILRLGHAYLTASLPRLLRPTLEDLASSIHESCSASVLDGHEIVYVARAAQERLMGVGLHPGSRLPAYCTSMGRVLLADLPPAHAKAVLERSERRSYTPRTLVDLAGLMDELERVRMQGYSIIDQEIETGACSIAVPIRNLSKKAVTAFNVALHVNRCAPDLLKERFLPALLRAQSQLAELIS